MTATDFTADAGLIAGTARTDITPRRPVFLFGYPHVPRTSTGVHDPLECAALYLRAGRGHALFLAHDLIFIPREVALAVRRRVAQASGVPEEAILLSATHTHSGPNTVDQVSNGADSVVPPVDQEYLGWITERAVEAALAAIRDARPAEIGFARAQAEGVGTNRHDPRGAADPDVPVLVVRSRDDHEPFGCMLVYAMHPTVLHEDSTLISGDFPPFTRDYLRRTVLPANCPVVYHNGASGDQSPRHVTRGNTFAEAQRIGETLGAAVAEAVRRMAFMPTVAIAAWAGTVDLVSRRFPPSAATDAALGEARSRHASLKAGGAPGPQLRTAECDVFGAEETAELARAAANGTLAAAIAARTPAEIQVLRVGPWKYVGWPGEFFVSYALAVRATVPDTFVITLANGELQGYIVTPEAEAQGWYEALNAVFAPGNGSRFVQATLDLLKNS
jgi:hypothetical protein